CAGGGGAGWPAPSGGPGRGWPPRRPLPTAGAIRRRPRRLPVPRRGGHMSPDPATVLELYRGMLTIRRFEERAGTLFEAGQIPGSLHVCIGQEAVAVGVCAALRRDDYATSTHRGHGHCR